MTISSVGRYNELVHGIWWRGAVPLLLALFFFGLIVAPARADDEFGVGPTPVLNVQLSKGTLNIQTWDRPTVQVVSTGNVNVQHLDPSVVDSHLPKQVPIPPQTIQTEHGPVSLPAESFMLPQLSGTQHDAIVARGSGNTTIMIPKGTALVWTHVNGHVSLNNYKGVFVANVRNGGVSLNHVQGSGFVESLRGGVVASDSTFDRLRVRTATGNMMFKGCTSHQIEANSTYGSIVYDNGKFQPGLARFESEHGNIALGVQGGAQIGAHSGSGHVVSSFHSDAHIQGGATTTQATVRGGGPVVTATTKNGSVYLYNGSLHTHPKMQAALHENHTMPATTIAHPAFARPTITTHAFPQREPSYSYPSQRQEPFYAPQRGFSPYGAPRQPSPYAPQRSMPSYPMQHQAPPMRMQAPPARMPAASPQRGGNHPPF